MSLFTTTQYRQQLCDALQRARCAVRIGSAYITLAGIETVLNCISGEMPSVKVLARWDSCDLVSGASDLEVYEALRSRGFDFHICQTLHGKFALIDWADLFVGSANLTAAGLAVGIRGNWECGVVCQADEADRHTISALFAGSVQVTDSLYSEIKDFVLPLRAASVSAHVVFPPSIAEQLQSSTNGLWVRDLPWTDDPAKISLHDENARHDLLLLSLGSGQPVTRELGVSFQNTSCCKWLTAKLVQHSGQLYFGEASELLHDALLEDPKPYRKDVKTLVHNLFSWARLTLPHIFVVDCPQHSQRIRLTDGADEEPGRSHDLRQGWIDRLRNLRRDEIPGRWGSETKFGAPHKALLLLAVLKNTKEGKIGDLRRIALTEELEATFYMLWHALFGSTRATNIALPFIHLSGDDVWTVFAEDGTQVNNEDGRSLRHLQATKAYAQPEPSLGGLLSDPQFRKEAGRTLVESYFSEKVAGLLLTVLSRPTVP